MQQRGSGSAANLGAAVAKVALHLGNIRQHEATHEVPKSRLSVINSWPPLVDRLRGMRQFRVFDGSTSST